MSYTQSALSQDPIDVVWHLATLGNKSSYKRLQKREIVNLSIPDVCHIISEETNPDSASLRVSLSLLYGVSIAYKLKVEYILADASHVKRLMLKGRSNGRLGRLYCAGKNVIMPVSTRLAQTSRNVFLQDDQSFDIQRDLVPRLLALENDLETPQPIEDEGAPSLIHTPSDVSGEQNHWPDFILDEPMEFENKSIDGEFEFDPILSAHSRVDQPSREAIPDLLPIFEAIDLHLPIPEPVRPSTSRRVTSRHIRSASRIRKVRVDPETTIRSSAYSAEREMSAYKPRALEKRFSLAISINSHSSVSGLSVDLRDVFRKVYLLSDDVYVRALKVQKRGSDRNGMSYSDIEIGRYRSRSSSLSRDLSGMAFGSSTPEEGRQQEREPFIEPFFQGDFEMPDIEEAPEDDGFNFSENRLSIDIMSDSSKHGLANFLQKFFNRKSTSRNQFSTISEQEEPQEFSLQKQMWVFYDSLQNLLLSSGYLFNPEDAPAEHFSGYLSRRLEGGILREVPFSEIVPAKVEDSSTQKRCDRPTAATSFLCALELALIRKVDIVSKLGLCKPQDIMILFNTKKTAQN